MCMLFFGAYLGFQFVTTLYYRDELGWSPLQAGLAFLLGGVLTAATASTFAAAVSRVGPWPIAVLGLAMLTVGYLVWVILIGSVNAAVILLLQQVLGGGPGIAAHRGAPDPGPGEVPSGQDRISGADPR